MIFGSKVADELHMDVVACITGAGEPGDVEFHAGVVVLFLRDFEHHRLVGADRDFETVNVARLLEELLGLQQLPSVRDRVLDDDCPFVGGAILERVGPGVANLVIRRQVPLADFEKQLRAR